MSNLTTQDALYRPRLVYSKEVPKITKIFLFFCGDSMVEMYHLKKCPGLEFETKDHGALRYFHGMEAAQQKKGIFVSQ